MAGLSTITERFSFLGQTITSTRNVSYGEPGPDPLPPTQGQSGTSSGPSGHGTEKRVSAFVSTTGSEYHYQGAKTLTTTPVVTETPPAPDNPDGPTERVLTYTDIVTATPVETSGECTVTIGHTVQQTLTLTPWSGGDPQVTEALLYDSSSTESDSYAEQTGSLEYNGQFGYDSADIIVPHAVTPTIEGQESFTTPGATSNPDDASNPDAPAFLQEEEPSEGGDQEGEPSQSGGDDDPPFPEPPRLPPFIPYSPMGHFLMGAHGFHLENAERLQETRESGSAGDDSLIWELTQSVADLAGVVDPTPVSDGLNLAMSLIAFDLTGTAISAASLVPYVGDLAKLGKLPKFVHVIERVLNRAAESPQFAARVKPLLSQLREAIGTALESDYWRVRLPESAVDALRSIKSKLDDFFSAAHGVSPVFDSTKFPSKVRSKLNQLRKRYPWIRRGEEGVQDAQKLAEQAFKRGGGRVGPPVGQGEQFALYFEDGPVTWVFRPNGHFWSMRMNPGWAP